MESLMLTERENSYKILHTNKTKFCREGRLPALVCSQKTLEKS